MREFRAYAFVHFLASSLTQTSNVPKAITQADLALKAVDERFPMGEDREVADLRRQLEQRVDLIERVMALCETSTPDRLEADVKSLVEFASSEHREARALRVAAGQEP